MTYIHIYIYILPGNRHAYHKTIHLIWVYDEHNIIGHLRRILELPLIRVLKIFRR